MKGIHSEPEYKRNARELDETIKNLVRLRNEIDPHYVPHYPGKPRGIISRLFDRIAFVVDMVTVYGFYFYVALIGGVVLWALVSALFAA